MSAYINRYDFVLVENQFQCYPVTKVDRNRMELAQAPLQLVQPERRMKDWDFNLKVLTLTVNVEP
jgi:hypothetical protein